MKYLMIILLVASCASPKAQRVLQHRSIASLEVSQNEQYLQALISDSIMTYAHYPFTVDVANSTSAIQYTVNYASDDYERIYGLGGMRKRNLEVLINEQFLALQEKVSIQNKTKFDITKTKRVFVKFNEKEE